MDKRTYIDYIKVRIVDVQSKTQEMERVGFKFVGELSPEQAARHISEPLKMDETVLCFSHPYTPR
jgi:hypothetical protein